MKAYKFSILILILLFTSCRKNLEDMNVDPSNPTTTNPDYVFNYSVSKAMLSYGTEVNAGQWGLMYWMMYIAPLGGIDEDKKYLMSESKDGIWSETYIEALNNAQEVIRLTKDDPKLSNKTNIARIWKVILFQRLTDLWGYIPYSEALKGIDEYILQPKYDSQESIYNAMIFELKDAASQLDVSKETFPTEADQIYNGDLSKWKKYANSLRLKLAIRISFVLPLVSQTEIADLLTAELISNNNENAIFPYSTTSPQNPFYQVIVNNQGFYNNNPSKYLIDLLNTSNDPRLKIYAKPTPESIIYGFEGYVGIPNLLPPNASQWDDYDQNKFNFSDFGNWFMRFDAPAPILTYSEVCFLKAEAALSGWYSGSAQEYYEQGVRANIEYYNDSTVTPGEIDAYIASLPPVSLENIITQKYISLAFQNEYEAYAEYRRTGFPVLKDYFGNPIDNVIFPKRLVYPSSERNLNSDNYNEAVQSQGPDDASTRVWWDVN